MPITKRTLEKWRSEALKVKSSICKFPDGLDADKWTKYMNNPLKDGVVEMQNRILRLTQELLDQHLLERSRK